MNIGYIEGGANAGWRTVKAQAKADWVCPSCKAKLRYHWVRCPICKHPRD